jgi:hypothetical protein
MDGPTRSFSWVELPNGLWRSHGRKYTRKPGEMKLICREPRGVARDSVRAKIGNGWSNPRYVRVVAYL